MSLYILVQILWIVFLIKGNPFKTKDIKLISLVNESSYILLLFIYLFFEQMLKIERILVFICITLSMPLGNLLVGAFKAYALLSRIPFRRYWKMITPQFNNLRSKTIEVDPDLDDSKESSEKFDIVRPLPPHSPNNVRRRLGSTARNNTVVPGMYTQMGLTSNARPSMFDRNHTQNFNNSKWFKYIIINDKVSFTKLIYFK